MTSVYEVYASSEQHLYYQIRTYKTILNANVRFNPIQTKFVYSEQEIIFSIAVSKYQHLMILDEI